MAQPRVIVTEPIDGVCLDWLSERCDVTEIDLTADGFHATGFFSSGMAMAVSDFNGDGNTDIGVSSNLGEMIVFLGDGSGSFVHSGRTWTLPTVPGLWPSRVHGIAAADMNRDGLAEIFVGDIGANPMSLIVWLNTSR